MSIYCHLYVRLLYRRSVHQLKDLCERPDYYSNASSDVQIFMHISNQPEPELVDRIVR